jgi:CRISPR-associated protein Cas1
LGNSKTQKIILDGYGSYLGMERGCFTVKDRQGNINQFPLFESEIGKIVLKSGNMVSTGALASCGFWDIDVTILTQRGRPVAMLKSFDDDAHVVTRLHQYEAYNNDVGVYLAKQFVLEKFNGQNIILEKNGLETHDEAYFEKLENVSSDKLNSTLRRRLMAFESKFSKHYFTQILTLLPEKIRPKGRRTFRAYDGIDNLFNLAYELLQWRVHRALVNAKLEPYLGFLHSMQYGKPSLVCDFQELYRHNVDDFVIGYCKDFKKSDFIVKTEDATRKKRGKRVYLNDVKTKEMMQRLNEFFESYLKVPRIRVGNQQTLETLINEEALLFAKYLREKQNQWKPRILAG